MGLSRALILAISKIFVRGEMVKIHGSACSFCTSRKQSGWQWQTRLGISSLNANATTDTRNPGLRACSKEEHRCPARRASTHDVQLVSCSRNLPKLHMGCSPTSIYSRVSIVLLSANQKRLLSAWVEVTVGDKATNWRDVGEELCILSQLEGSGSACWARARQREFTASRYKI